VSVSAPTNPPRTCTLAKDAFIQVQNLLCQLLRLSKNLLGIIGRYRLT